LPGVYGFCGLSLSARFFFQRRHGLFDLGQPLLADNKILGKFVSSLIEPELAILFPVKALVASETLLYLLLDPSSAPLTAWAEGFLAQSGALRLEVTVLYPLL